MFTLTKALSGFTFFAAALSAFANPMTQAEREHLVAHLEMTQAWLTDEVSRSPPRSSIFARSRIDGRSPR